MTVLLFLKIFLGFSALYESITLKKNQEHSLVFNHIAKKWSFFKILSDNILKLLDIVNNKHHLKITLQILKFTAKLNLKIFPIPCTGIITVNFISVNVLRVAFFKILDGGGDQITVM